MAKAIDLTGLRFGMLTVLRRSEEDHNNWMCKCDCGSTKLSSRSNLKHKTTGLHCGCQKRTGKIIDLTGQRFGRLLVLGIFGRSPSNKISWKCGCDCGEEVNVLGTDLRYGKSRSCGCAPRGRQIRDRSKHGEARKNAHTPRYEMWSHASVRARKRGVPFDIELEDIFIPETCPLLGVDLAISKGCGAEPNSPTLDKIVPELGYTKGNVWVISHRANTIKSDASLEELKLLTKNLEKKFDELDGNPS
jgi:hypothetical protein